MMMPGPMTRMPSDERPEQLRVPPLHAMDDVAAQIEKSRVEAESRGERVLYFDLGNSLAGSDMLNRVEEGGAAARLLAEVGCEGIFPGDVEWTLGPKRLKSLSESSGLALICSNVEGEAFVRPRRVFSSVGAQVAVYGWYEPPFSPRLRTMRREFRGVRFDLGREELFKSLSREDAAVVLLLAAVDDYHALARQLPRPCVILPARDSGTEDLSKLQTVGQATIAPHVEGRRALGRVSCRVTIDGVTETEASLASYPAKPAAGGADRFAALLQTCLASLEGTLLARRTDLALALPAVAPRPLRHPSSKEPSQAGGWVCEVVLDHVAADGVLLNHQAFRDSISRVPSIRGQIFALAPFGNDLVVLEIPGRLLRTLLVRNVDENRRYLQMAGISSSYVPGRPESARAWVGGKPLDEARSYRIVTNDYLAGGARGQEPLFASCRVVARPGVCLNHLLWDRLWSQGWIEPARRWMARETSVVNHRSWETEWDDCRRRLARTPDDPALRRNAASILLGADLPEAALEALHRPVDGEGWLLKGRIQLVLMEYRSAMEDMDRACTLLPGRLDARMLLGWTALGAGHAARALAAWKEARKLAGEDDAEEIDRLVAMLSDSHPMINPTGTGAP